MTESLASFNLDTADNDVISWSFDASAVQTDMLTVLKATNPAARASAQATLRADLGDARQATSRHRRDLDRGQEFHGRDRRVPQPADLGTAILVSRYATCAPQSPDESLVTWSWQV